jgi:hypothetical protein
MLPVPALMPHGDYSLMGRPINTFKEILLQESHSQEMYAVEFQGGGALTVSAYILFYS